MDINNKIKLSPFVRFIKREQDIIAYHSLCGGLCIIDESIYEILKDFNGITTISGILDKYKDVYDDMNDIIDTFYNKNFLIDEGYDDYNLITDKEKNRMEKLQTGEQIKVIQLVVTNNCNFRCKYCFINSIYSSKERHELQSLSSNKTMSSEQAISYIDTVIKECNKTNGSLNIQFFGGEPLINWKAIKSVLDYFQNGERYNMNINYSIVTNGSLIDEEIAQYFKKYNVAIIISFDSPNKSDRIMNNGEKSLDIIKNNFKMLKQNNNFVTINAVLASDTYDYFGQDLVKFAVENNISEIGVLFDLDTKFYENKSVNDIADKLWDLYVEAKEKEIVVTGYWHKIYEQIILSDHFKDSGFKTCSGTGSQLSIEPSGDIFGCKGSSGYYGNIFKLKDLFNSDRYKMYAQRSFRNSPLCYKCELEGFCSGFCLGPLEKKYGNIYALETKYCELVKELVHRLIIDTIDADRFELVD